MTFDADELINAYLDDRLTPEQATALNTWVKSDREHARRFIDALNLHTRLREQLRSTAALMPAPVTPRWRSLLLYASTLCSLLLFFFYALERQTIAKLKDDKQQLQAQTQALDEAHTRARQTSIELADTNQQLRADNRHGTAARQLLAHADSGFNPSGALHLIAYAGELTNDPPPAKETVRVEVLNDYFPARLKWKANDQAEQTTDLPRSDSTLQLPVGKVRLVCDSSISLAWYQSFGLVHHKNGKVTNRDYLGTSLGPVVLELKAGDVLRLRMEQPFTPWNATMIRVGTTGEWAIVTLERAWANYDVEPFQKGKWGGSEAFPNTALFWAKEGSKGLATELAQQFVSERDKKGFGGRMRGKMHTSIIVPVRDGKAVAPFATLTADELVPHLTQAFENLRQQRPPLGPTIQQEIDAATKLLPTLTPRKP